MKNRLLISMICTIFFFLPVLANGKDSTKENVAKESGRNISSTNLVVSGYSENSINDEINTLRRKVNEQSQKIDRLLEMTNKRSLPIKEFITSIVLSIIAAIIFWLAFALLPERHRLKRLRPKLELDVYHIYRTLFSIFDLIMRHNGHSPSSFQQQIKGGKLGIADIELGLQNKCLNESYFYDANVSKLLLPAGQGLFEKANTVDVTTEKLFNFSNYLSTEEILLLEQIRKKLQVYDLNNYSRNAVSVLGGIPHTPLNPSISYMTNNIFEIYNLYIQLQDLIFKYSYIDRDVIMNKVQCYYYSGQYDKCKAVISSALKKYPTDIQFLNFYSFLCAYMNGETLQAYMILETILKDKPHLVSNRNFLKTVIDDPRINELIKNSFSETEIREFHSVLRKEMDLEQAFIDQAKKLKDYYQQKSSSMISNNKST